MEEGARGFQNTSRRRAEVRTERAEGLWCARRAVFQRAWACVLSWSIPALHRTMS